jgi:hypothetical protein
VSQQNELFHVLDLIWKSTNRHATASEMVRNGIPNSALSTLLVSVFQAIGGQWLNATTSVGNYGQINLKYKNINLESMVTISDTKGKLCLMFLTDANLFLNAESKSFSEAWGEHKTFQLSDLLLAKQYARDRSESLLLLPSRARSRAIETASRDLGISQDLLIALCVQSPSMRQVIESQTS